MRAKPKLDLGLSAYEELFMDANERAVQKLPRIYDIPIDLIDDFPDHPFKVKQDENMELLAASIKEQGLITPVTIRPKDNGRYEMVSGHRRKEACKLAGLTSIKADVRELTRDEAIILMVESNLQRSVILPSEKAFSYKMRLEALKRQGKRTDLTSDPVGRKLESAEIIGRDTGDSRNQVRRYIRLTELITPLLDLVDMGKIALRPAVELSYLSKEEQRLVYESILNYDCTPSHDQTIRMKKFSEDGKLTDAVIEAIMREEKPNQKEKVHIPLSQLRKYIPDNVSYDDTRDYILQALKFYTKHGTKTA